MLDRPRDLVQTSGDTAGCSGSIPLSEPGRRRGTQSPSGRMHSVPSGPVPHGPRGTAGIAGRPVPGCARALLRVIADHLENAGGVFLLQTDGGGNVLQASSWRSAAKMPWRVAWRSAWATGVVEQVAWVTVSPRLGGAPVQADREGPNNSVRLPAVARRAAATARQRIGSTGHRYMHDHRGEPGDDSPAKPRPHRGERSPPRPGQRQVSEGRERPACTGGAVAAAL